MKGQKLVIFLTELYDKIRFLFTFVQLLFASSVLNSCCEDRK